MPLTPAHAAAAWPIARLAPRLPLAALVIGTLSPDFEYFLHLAPRSDFSHSLAGVALFCLPASLAAWATFEGLIVPAVRELLPAGMSASHAANGVPARRAGTVGLGVLAALLGAATHIAWDSFTHEHGWAVTRIPALEAEVARSSWGVLRWYKVLQHGSTIGGLVIVFAWLARAWAQYPPEARHFAPGQAARTIRLMAFLASCSAVAGILNLMRARHDNPAQMLGFAVVGAMLGLILATTAFGAIARVMRRQPR